MQIFQCRSKRRRIQSATAQLDKEYVQEQEIDEIDLPDVHNQLAVVEYIKDLYTFYREQQHMCGRVDYMKKQPQVNEKKRAVAIGWMVKLHYHLGMCPETLYLAVSIMDRFLSLDVILKQQLQLVAVCALLISSKYEENQALKVTELVQYTGYTYSKEVIICMEKIMLNRLNWYLTIKAAYADKELENMIYFFGELGLMEYRLIQHCPCKVAAAAVYAARCTLGKSPLWTDTLRRHTSYSEPEIQECVQILAKAHKSARGSKHKLRVIYTKYQHERFGRVSVCPPALALIEEPHPGVLAAS